MRVVIGALALSASLWSSVTLGDVEQISIASHANPDRACELTNYSGDDPFPTSSEATATLASCSVSVPKVNFNNQFQFCALSTIRENNDDKSFYEHDYGSHCGFEILDEQVVFSAVRGFGFHEDSTSMLYCQFTCVGPGTGSSSQSLTPIESEPLPPFTLSEINDTQD